MSQRDKPQLALNNITAGVREREDANRTREAGHLDEIQGVVANAPKLSREGAVGFIVWLGLFCEDGITASELVTFRKEARINFFVNMAILSTVTVPVWVVKKISDALLHVWR